jgi:hypothetical protein
MKLKDGSESGDPRLGRIKWHDPRSKLHPVSHTMCFFHQRRVP